MLNQVSTVVRNNGHELPPKNSCFYFFGGIYQKFDSFLFYYLCIAIDPKFFLPTNDHITDPLMADAEISTDTARIMVPPKKFRRPIFGNK